MINLRSLLVGFSVFTLLAFPLFGQDEDEPIWTGSHGYKEVRIHIGHGTIPAGGTDWVPTSSVSGGIKQAEGGGLYRFMTFASGITILYEFSARPLPDKDGSFEVTIGPYVPTLQQAESWKIDPRSVETGFMRKYPAPFVVKDNETIALEVAENPKTGQKLVHYYVVSKGKPFLRSNLERKAAKAREFRVQDVELRVFDYDLRRNGASLYRSGGGCSGKYIAILIPDVGRFWFTLTPPPVEARFEPSALVKDGQLWFRYGEDVYEWLSPEHIVPGDGLFNIWMRFDPPEGRQSSFSVAASSRPPR
ncbi:MAG: hypothetical protein EHM18_00960 [Acidobacteria bacterium]|nr:MAG: hypothetical protein EHM18_00960 [Acidobacteriota bacterium]